MGQCSTLPSEGGGNAVMSPSAKCRHQEQDYQVAEHDASTPLNKPSAKQNTSGFLQSHVPAAYQQAPSSHSRQPVAYSSHNTQVYGAQPMSSPPPNNQRQHVNIHTNQMPPTQPTYEPPPPQLMEERRETAPTTQDSSIRTRCYKLNLDSDVGMSSPPNRLEKPQRLGPFDTLPSLTQSLSDDLSIAADPNVVAVQTAQIFRDITVTKDGNIVSHNARANRSSRNKSKRGEKSRQAEKIDKANDLVEETMITGKAPGSEKAAKIVSLIAIGEYDDMNHLVRDGAKKLRDGVDLSEEALYAINRRRQSGGGEQQQYSRATPLSGPTRKRIAPHIQQLGQVYNNPTTPTKSVRYKTTSMPQSAPSKLKAHPRDRPSQRKNFPVRDPCNSMFGGQHGIGPGNVCGESLTLSKGLNSLWICGAPRGAASPPPYVDMQNERRNEMNYASSQRIRMSDNGHSHREGIGSPIHA